MYLYTDSSKKNKLKIVTLSEKINLKTFNQKYNEKAYKYIDYLIIYFTIAILYLFVNFEGINKTHLLLWQRNTTQVKFREDNYKIYQYFTIFT